MIKVIYTLILLVYSELSCAQQILSDGCWVPKEYIASMNTPQPMSQTQELLSAISYIYAADGKVGIIFWRSDIQLVNLKRIGLDKYEMSGFLMPYSITKLGAKKFYLSKIGDDLLLEIQKNDKIDTVLYSDNFHGLKLVDPWNAATRFALMGTYDVFDSNRILIQPKVTISFEGTVGNWTYLSFLSEGTGVYDARRNRTVQLVTAINQDRKDRFALDIDEAKNFLIYDYSNTNKKSQVLTTSLVYVLQRVY